MFNILNLDTENIITDMNGEPLVFETGAEANAECKRLAEYTHLKRLRPQKTGENKNWRKREQTRFESGEYTLPDYLQPLLQTRSESVEYNLPEFINDHYLHLAKDKPGLLAYTQNESKGRADIQTRISLSGYLELYNEKLPIPLSAKEITALLETHNAVILSEDGLKFATTPKEIEYVYTHFDEDCDAVNESCMRYSKNMFEGKPSVHPCTIYGAGDLAIAYFANSDNETTARALCWPEKKIYSRVYGSSRLHEALKARGFRKSTYYGCDGASFAGAKLLRILHYGNVYVMPYIDESLCSEDKGEYLILSPEGTIENDRTCGLSEEITLSECEYCGDAIITDDRYAIYTERYDFGYYCEECQSEHAFYCDKRQMYYAKECVAAYIMQNGETWSIYAFQDDGAICPRTGEKYDRHSGNVVIIDETGKTELWSPKACEGNTWECKCGCCYYVSNKVACIKVYDNESDLHTKCADPCTKKLAFLCEWSNRYYWQDYLVILDDGRKVARCHVADATDAIKKKSNWKSIVALKLNFWPDPERQLSLFKVVEDIEVVTINLSTFSTEPFYFDYDFNYKPRYHSYVYDD